MTLVNYIQVRPMQTESENYEKMHFKWIAPTLHITLVLLLNSVSIYQNADAKLLSSQLVARKENTADLMTTL